MVKNFQSHLASDVDDPVPDKGGELDTLIDGPTQGYLTVTESMKALDPVTETIFQDDKSFSLSKKKASP